jgi:hypothetical protein
MCASMIGCKCPYLNFNVRKQVECCTIIQRERERERERWGRKKEREKERERERE